MIDIEFFKKIELEGYTFIEGFPGTGLVGPMSISYMINKMQLEYVGYMKSDLLPPLISIHNNIPLPPIRFYHSKKYKLLVLFSESGPTNEKGIYEIADTLYKFIRDRKISQIISISGIPVQNIEDAKGFAVASNKKLYEKTEKAGLKSIGEGVAAGVGAVLMMHATIDNIDDINILVQANPQIIDPGYAELAIKSINKLLNINVDVSELDKEAKAVEEKLKELIKRSKETKPDNTQSELSGMYT